MHRSNFLRIVAVSLVLFCIAAVTVYAQKKYEPTWESLDSRPIPQWYDDAKFGIKICWGLFSVPAWGTDNRESQRCQQQELCRVVLVQYQRPHGPITGDSMPALTAAIFSISISLRCSKPNCGIPEEWAELIKRAGAKYIILITKHHDWVLPLA